MRSRQKFSNNIQGQRGQGHCRGGIGRAGGKEQHLAHNARHEAAPEEGHRNAQGHLVQANVPSPTGHEAQVTAQGQAAATSRTGPPDGCNGGQAGAVQACQHVIGQSPELRIALLGGLGGIQLLDIIACMPRSQLWHDI